MAKRRSDGRRTNRGGSNRRRIGESSRSEPELNPESDDSRIRRSNRRSNRRRIGESSRSEPGLNPESDDSCIRRSNRRRIGESSRSEPELNPESDDSRIRRTNRGRMGETSRSKPELNPESESETESDDSRIRYICDEASKENRVVPVLPRFQADVPEWTHPGNKAIPDGYLNDPETLKWLGNVTWPIGDNNGKNGGDNDDKNKLVGRGRRTGCECRKPGGVHCEKRHVAEEIARQKTELGPAFDSWKFHNLGESEDYFWDWTLKEYKQFIGVLKNPALQSSTFLTAALNAVPSIPRRRDILKYYFHFLVQKRLARETRLGLENIDSDDDELMQKQKYLSA